MHDGVIHHRHCPRASPASQSGTNDASIAAITTSRSDITTTLSALPLISTDNPTTTHAFNLGQALSSHFQQRQIHPQHQNPLSTSPVPRIHPPAASRVTAFSDYLATPLRHLLSPPRHLLRPPSFTPNPGLWPLSESTDPVMDNHEGQGQRQQQTPLSGNLYYQWPQDASDDVSAAQQESSQQFSFINPAEMHNDIQRADVGDSQLFSHDLEPIFPHSTMSSPYIQAAATPRSNCGSPASCRSGTADAASVDDAEIDVSEPYNVLLHRCLMEAPYQERMLREIYDWFIQNTDKGRKDKSKGWQNSIRHNLSMNPAFEKGSRSQQNPNVANMWSLSEEAIEHGVQPTTRFRNTANRLTGRNRLRANTTTGAVRKARSSSRMRPYNLRDTAPRSSPGLVRSNTDIFPQTDEQQNQVMLDSIRAWNGEGGSNNVSNEEVVGPYFETRPQTAGPLQDFSFLDGATYNGFGQLQSLVSTAEARVQAAPQQYPQHEPLRGIYPTFNINAGAPRPTPGSGRARDSPPLSTPSLEEAPLSGMWDDSGEGPLFMSDDEYDHRALRTPPPPADMERMSSVPDHKPSSGNSGLFFPSG